MSAPTSRTSSTSHLSSRSRDVDSMRQQLLLAMANERRMSRSGSAASRETPTYPAPAQPYPAAYPQYLPPPPGPYPPPPPPGPWMPPMYNGPYGMPPQYPMSPPIGMPPMSPPAQYPMSPPGGQGGWQEYYRRIGLVPAEGFPERGGEEELERPVEHAGPAAPIETEKRGPIQTEARPEARRPTIAKQPTTKQKPVAILPVPDPEPALAPQSQPEPQPPKAKEPTPKPPRTRRATWSPTEAPGWNSSTAVEKKRAPSLAFLPRVARNRVASDVPAASSSTVNAPAAGVPIGMMAADDGTGTPVMFRIPPNTTMTISFGPVPAPPRPEKAVRGKK